jgi:anthranilate phosphoribosyltransferase
VNSLNVLRHSEHALADLRHGKNLEPEQVQGLLSALIEGTVPEDEAAAILLAWHQKGESGQELAAAAGVMRKLMLPFETGRTDLVDTCGTGGAKSGAFNISTAAAFVVAGAGVPVVKHGNRAVTSQSGSGDVLEALGVKLQPGVVWPRRCLEQAGMAFCLAPAFHPAMARLGPVRKRVGVRTIFNCLGPLANPAGAAFQVVGVGRLELLEPMSEALATLGTGHSFVVVGEDGLGEITLGAATQVREIREGKIRPLRWQPSDFGLPACGREEFAANNPAESATIIRGVLDGAAGPCADIVLANAAAVFLAAGKVQDLPAGVALARASIESGRARDVLEKLIVA